MATNIIPILGS